MTRRVILSAGLKAGAALSALLLAACAEESAEDAAQDNASIIEEAEENALETEGGNDASYNIEPAPVVRSGDPADDDVEFVYRLGLIRGHLAAFKELYSAGAVDMASTHARHPEDEVYTDLMPAFAARGVDGFAEDLKRLADAANGAGDIDSIYASTVVAIRATAPDISVSEKLLVIAKITETAGEEFENGVAEDGSIREPHEYHDAFGLLTVAREMLSSENSSDINAAEAIAVSHEQLDLCLDAFAGLIVEETEGEAATLYAAAAFIERAAARL